MRVGTACVGGEVVGVDHANAMVHGRPVDRPVSFHAFKAVNRREGRVEQRRERGQVEVDPVRRRRREGSACHFLHRARRAPGRLGFATFSGAPRTMFLMDIVATAKLCVFGMHAEMMKLSAWLARMLDTRAGCGLRVAFVDRHHCLVFLLVQIHQFDLVFVRKVRVAQDLETLHGVADRGFGDDRVVELADGFEKLQGANERIGMRGGQSAREQNIVRLDHHAAIADGLGDFLLQRLERAEDVVGAIDATGQAWWLHGGRGGRQLGARRPPRVRPQEQQQRGQSVRQTTSPAPVTSPVLRKMTTRSEVSGKWVLMINFAMHGAIISCDTLAESTQGDW